MKVEEAAIKYKFPMSPEEFLRWERKADTKHEYIHGEVISMAGASFVHNTIVANIMGHIYPYLKGKSCHIYPGDLRVTANDPKGTYYYPDATIICGDPEFTDDNMDTIKNPSVIFEVLSPSTRDYDLGTKFISYRRIPSLKQFIAISSTEIKIYSGERKAGMTWKLDDCSELEESLHIVPAGQHILLKDIYETVSFPPLP